MDYIEILKLLIGCALGAGVLFVGAYYYQAWKSEYLRAEAEREDCDDD